MITFAFMILICRPTSFVTSLWDFMCRRASVLLPIAYYVLAVCKLDVLDLGTLNLKIVISPLVKGERIFKSIQMSCSL